MQNIDHPSVHNLDYHKYHMTHTMSVQASDQVNNRVTLISVKKSLPFNPFRILEMWMGRYQKCLHQEAANAKTFEFWDTRKKHPF